MSELPDLLKQKAVIFAGHYGSGKTNLAINYALALKKQIKEQVLLCDVDIVNPYFRTKDSEGILRAHGIRLISTLWANSNLDIPAIPPETAAAFASAGVFSVFDVGGDDSGAIALGQFSDRIQEQGYDMMLVVNRHRFLTATPEELMAFLHEMEVASRLRFTGLVNNSNIGIESSAEDFIESIPFIKKVSQLSGLPIKYHCIRKDLVNERVKEIENLFPIRIFNKPNWKLQEDDYGESSI